MKDVKIIRRTWGTTNYLHDRDMGPALMRVVIPNADIYIRMPALDYLGITAADGQGISFVFEKDGSAAYVFKDEHPLAFRFQKTKKVWTSLKFSSKDLMIAFIEHFKIDDRTGSVWFKVADKPNANGWHQLTLNED